MSFVDEAGVRHFKLVYFGSSLGGKSTNFQYLYSQLPPEQRSAKMISYEAELWRTLAFDFEPPPSRVLSTPVRFHLYCCPGSVFYEAPRADLLKGVGGLVYVARRAGRPGGRRPLGARRLRPTAG